MRTSSAQLPQVWDQLCPFQSQLTASGKLTVGHHRNQHPVRKAVDETWADHTVHLLSCTLIWAETSITCNGMVHLSQDWLSATHSAHYRLARLNIVFSLRSKLKKIKILLENPSSLCSLIAEENQETETLLLNTSDRSAEIGLTYM